MGRDGRKQIYRAIYILITISTQDWGTNVSLVLLATMVNDSLTILIFPRLPNTQDGASTFMSAVVGLVKSRAGIGRAAIFLLITSCSSPSSRGRIWKFR